MRYFERLVLALLLLTWCCASPRSAGKHGSRPQRPGAPGRPAICFFYVCVPT